MIKLSVEKGELKLNAGSKVSIEHSSPMFTHKDFSSPYTLPFALSRAFNETLLSFPHKHDINGRMRMQDATLDFGTWPFKEGKLVLLSADDDKISSSFIFDLAAFSIMRKSIRDIDFGSPVLMGFDQDAVIATAKTMNESFWPDVPFVFPLIKNDAFYNGSNSHYRGYMNLYDTPTGQFVKNVVSGPDTYNYNTLVPQIFLCEVLKKGFAMEGYTLDGEFINTETAQILLYSNVSIDAPNFDYRIGAIFSSDFQINPTQPDTTLIFDNELQDNGNAHNNATGEVTIIAAGTYTISLRLNVIPPSQGQQIMKVQLIYDGNLHGSANINYWPSTNYAVFTIVASAGDIGKKFHINFSNYNDAGLAPVIMAESSLGVTVVLSGGGAYALNTYKSLLKVNEHLPDIEFGSLFSAVKTAFNLYHIIDESSKIVYLNFSKTQFNLNSLDKNNSLINEKKIDYTPIGIKSFAYTWPSDDALLENNLREFSFDQFIGSYYDQFSFPTPVEGGLIALSKRDNKLWVSYYDGSGFEWKIFGDNYRTIKYNPEDPNEIVPAFAPMLMSFHDFFINLDMILCPDISQTGSSDMFEIGQNDFALRMMFWRGMIEESHNDTYPLASSVDYNCKDGGRVFEETFAITDINEIDLITTHWKKAIEMLAVNETIIARFNMTLADILNFDITQPISFEYAEFFIKHVKIEVGDKIFPAEMKLLKIL